MFTLYRSRDRIIEITLIKRMTPEQPAYRKPGTFDGSILLNGLICIDRAGRVEPTMWPRKRRNKLLIYSDQ